MARSVKKNNSNNKKNKNEVIEYLSVFFKQEKENLYNFVFLCVFVLAL